MAIDLVIDDRLRPVEQHSQTKQCRAANQSPTLRCMKQIDPEYIFEVTLISYTFQNKVMYISNERKQVYAKLRHNMARNFINAIFLLCI